MTPGEPRQRRPGVRALLLPLLAAVLAASSSRAAPESVEPACAAAEVIVVARIATPPDEFDLVTVDVERTLKRGATPLPARLLVRTPRDRHDRPLLQVDERAAFLLVGDSLAGSLGALAPVDPVLGVLRLGAAADGDSALLRCLELLLDPPPLAEAASAWGTLLKGQGVPAVTAAGWFAVQPARARAIGPAAGALFESALNRRRLPPRAAADVVRALGHVPMPGLDATLVEALATQPDARLCQAVEDVLPQVADGFTPDHVRSAMLRCNEDALPLLLRLGGALRSPALVEDIEPHATASRERVRSAALEALGRIGDARALAVLERCAAAGDLDARSLHAQATARPKPLLLPLPQR